MKHRFRIAVSVFFALAAVAFAVLWVRSYRWRDEIFGVPRWSGTLAIVSRNGWLEVYSLAPTKNDILGDTHFPMNRFFGAILDLPNTLNPTVRHKLLIATPHWLGVIVPSLLAVAPWIRWRFSLRTMLITTTLIAVMLGLAVWASR